MGNELISVRRSSKIYLRDKYFDYPLRPLNAMFGLGIPTTARILADYVWETGQNRSVNKKEIVSLEDWVVSNFGRTMFNIYFKEYSEKVWGIDCSRISADLGCPAHKRALPGKSGQERLLQVQRQGSGDADGQFYLSLPRDRTNLRPAQG